MLNPIVIMCKSGTGVIWRIDVDALDLAGEFLFEGFKGKQVVAEDQAVVKEIGRVGFSRQVATVILFRWLGVLGVLAVSLPPELCMIRLLRILDQDARLQPWPVLLADPVEFQTSVGFCHVKSSPLNQ